MGCRHVWNLQVTRGCGRGKEKKQVQQSGCNEESQYSRHKKAGRPGNFFLQQRLFPRSVRKRKCFFIILTSSFFSKVGMRSVGEERGLVWGISCHFHLPHVAYICRALVIGNSRLLLLMLLVWQLAPGFVHAFVFYVNLAFNV
jgi:hypothetical protein